MNKRTLLAGAIVCAAFAPAFAQYGSPKSQALAGAWMVVSVVQTNPDGSKQDVFGKDPIGGVIFTPDGHFSVNFMRNDLPKVASGVRATATPDESAAIVRGSISYTGTYTADESELAMKIGASSFPAWVGQTQKRKYTVKGDELQYTGVTGVQGASVAVTIRRARP
jgi:hypothetical protein